jgi:hypothetical protein
MTRRQLLDFLEKKVRDPIEVHADEILAAIGPDIKKRRLFQLDRLHLDELIGKLEVEEFEDIEARLKQLSAGLVAGAKAMNTSLEKVKGFAKAADTFASVVGLVARIVALA